MANQKIIRTGLRFSCLAPEFQTKHNKKKNLEIQKECWQKPVFKPLISCEGCKYLEKENYD